MKEYYESNDSKDKTTPNNEKNGITLKIHFKRKKKKDIC